MISKEGFNGERRGFQWGKYSFNGGNKGDSQEGYYLKKWVVFNGDEEE